MAFTMYFAASHLSAYCPPPHSKCLSYVHKSNSISLASSKSSFIHPLLLHHHPFSFSSPPFFSNIITAQKSPLGDTLYHYSAKKEGVNIRLSTLKGSKVLLIVNIPDQGSELMNSQMKFLNELYDKYKSQGFEILGFLYDNSETGTKSGHGGGKRAVKKSAKFQIFDKVNLKEDDLWKFLKSYLTLKEIEGEFIKILVDSEGCPVAKYVPFPNEGQPQPHSLQSPSPGGRPSQSSTDFPAFNPLQTKIEELLQE